MKNNFDEMEVCHLHTYYLQSDTCMLVNAYKNTPLTLYFSEWIIYNDWSFNLINMILYDFIKYFVCIMNSVHSKV